MKPIRATVLLLAVLLPTSWTLAHAAEGAGGADGGMKPKKKGKKKKAADAEMSPDKK